MQKQFYSTLQFSL